MDCSRARTSNPSEWLELCPDFSRPLVEQLTDWILTWEPDLQEAIKWNMLCFSGRKLICGLSGCKRHLGITFFRGTELPDPHRLFRDQGANNTNIRTLRLTSLAEVDRGALQALIHAAAALDADPLIPPPPKVKRRPWPMPAFFKAALKDNPRAAAGFKSLAPSRQRDFLVWLSMAKRPETRARRLRETMRALEAGRNWIHRKKS
jgi:uncharacterized protein YdeI (YjbR/CyaY-like superfamily)